MMARIGLGVNMEFVRHDDKCFEWGVEKAAEFGYEYVEPMVHWGRELLSEAGYFHSVSMLDDPLRIRRACERAAIGISGLSAHTPLCKPEISTEYLKQAVRFAAEIGAPVVNTDEGPKPNWTTVDEDHVLMRYVLTEAAQHGRMRGILIGLEPHQQYSQEPRGAGPHLSARRFASHRHQLRHGQQLLVRPRSVPMARAGQRSTRAPPCQRYLGRAVAG